MERVLLKPGSVTLAELRAIWRGAPVALDEAAWAAVEASAAAKRLERVLTNDPGTGVMRHADAGYDIAVQCAREQKMKLPMLA